MKLPADKKQSRTKYAATIEALETIRARELASLTEDEALRQIESLQCAGKAWREHPNWSGLVLQQALFHGRKKK